MEEFGILFLGISTIAVGGGLAGIGLDLGVARFVPYYTGKGDEIRLRSMLRYALSASLVSGLGAGALLWLIGPWAAANLLHNFPLGQAMPICAACLPFTVTGRVLVKTVTAFQKIGYRVAISQVLNPLIRLILTVSLLVAGLGATGALWAYTAGEAFSTITLLYLVEKRIFPVFNLREKRHERIFEARAFIVYSLPLFLAGIIDLVMNYTDAYMSAYFLDNAQVGLYGAAVTLASLVALGTELLNPMFLSIITRDYALGNQTGIVSSYNNNNRWMWYITLPMAAFLIALPSESMSLLWGKSFANGAWPLAILAFGRAIYYLSTTSSVMLYMHGATRIILSANLCSASLNVILNYCLIPSLGITGAAIGTTVSLTLQSLFLVWGIHFYHRGQGLRVFFSGIFAAAVIPATILLLLKNHFPVSWSVIIGLAISYSAIYFLLLKVFRVFSAEDYRIWEAILARLRGKKSENS